MAFISICRKELFGKYFKNLISSNILSQKTPLPVYCSRCCARKLNTQPASKKLKLSIPFGLTIAGGAFCISLSAYKLFGKQLAPLVNAAERDDDNSPRRKFNFIANVVEIAAPAVVYIEIKGR